VNRVRRKPLPFNRILTNGKEFVMLVLNRKERETVVIMVNGIKIEVSVSEIRRGCVRLGFSAPEGVTILRKELYDVTEQRTTERELAADSK